MQTIEHMPFGNTPLPVSTNAVPSVPVREPLGQTVLAAGRTGRKVLEFNRPDAPVDPLHLIEAVTIRQSSDISDAAHVLARTVADHRMRIMVLPNISSRQQMTDAQGNDLNCDVFGWRPEADNADSLAGKCPIIRACRVEGEPFWVNRAGFRTVVRNPLLGHIKLRDLDQCSTHKAAIAVPVHLPFGEIAVAKLVSTDPAKADLSYEFARFGKLFADLSRRFIASYATAMRDNPYLPHEAVLSPREVECLRWAAFGKTDKEVGLILGASHATVRYHITRICKKLDATNRAQAVFRAGQLGYLGARA
jgi:DNA-binding CsgD family transcriptional regulator